MEKNAAYWVQSCEGEESESLYSWGQSSQQTLQRTLECLRCSVDSSERIVFVICLGSRKEEKKLARFLNDVQRCFDGLDQLVFVQNTVSNLEHIRSELSQKGDLTIPEYTKRLNDLKIKTLRMNMKDLKSSIDERSRLATLKGKHIMSPRNTLVEVPAPIVDRFTQKGLEIVASNECSEILHDPSINLVEFANKEDKKFMEGSPPSWFLFFFSEEKKHIPIRSQLRIEALVERDMVDTIMTNARSWAKQTTVCVKVLKIGHQIQTGATTICHHVLWRLRKEFLCVKLLHSGLDARETARALLDLQDLSHGEDASESQGQRMKSPKPILLLVDQNISSAEIANLKEKFQWEAEDQNIKYEKTMCIILHIKEGTSAETNDEKLDHVIDEKFSEREMRLFAAKEQELRDLTDEEGLAEESLVGFITFCCYFDIHNNKATIEGVYMRILQRINIYRSQLRLLLYLGIFKYFGNTGISTLHCRRILQEERGHVTKDLKCSLNATTQRFIRTTHAIDNVESLEVHSVPMAKFLMEQV